MRLFLVLLFSFVGILSGSATVLSDTPDEEFNDSTFREIDIEEVTIVVSPKENVRLRQQPLSVSLLDDSRLRTRQVTSLKGISNLTPNLFIPNYGSSLTSAIYIRGIGSRINTPAVGLYVDNVPFLDKSAFDFRFLDVERIDVLRGPQGTLYGRNAMGGLIRVHTRNPFFHQGTTLSLGMANGDNSARINLVHHQKLNDRIAFSVGGHFNESRGFFRNVTLNKWADARRSGGGNIRAVWLANESLKFDFKVGYSYTDESGYAYRYVGAIEPTAEAYPEWKGTISNNRPNGYWQSLLNGAVLVEWQAKDFILSAVTGYQHLKDDMSIDQDFLPVDIFSLSQRQRQHTLSQEVVLKSKPTSVHQHATGLFAFHQWLHTDAPVMFYADGVQMIQHAMNEGMSQSPVKVTLTDTGIHIPGAFDTPSTGLAFFHQSAFRLSSHLTMTVGLRLDHEQTDIDYETQAKVNATMSGTMGDMVMDNVPFRQTVRFDDEDSKRFFHLLPKLAIDYRIGQGPGRLYASFGKGLRAGGYNIQLFSEVVQAKFRGRLSPEVEANISDVIAYKPEFSYNYEVGTHLTLADKSMQLDAALFYIDTHDQQISRFTTNGLGRVMVNAGRGESYGAEISLRAYPIERLSLHADYGYTCATFREYDSAEQESTSSFTDYSGNYIPFVPRHTLSLGGDLSLPLPKGWKIEALTLRADYLAAGTIYWTESNTVSQPFYAQVNAGASLSFGSIIIDVWGRNLFNRSFDTFCFESLNRRFAQRGNPRQFGLDFRIKF